jgi:hypothetical protein
VYLYGNDNYQLTQYAYASILCGCKYYASNSFMCVNKNTFDEYCFNKSVDPKNYFVHDYKINMSWRNDNVNFVDYMNGLIKSRAYKLPTRIDYEWNEFGHETTFRLLERFKFIDVISLKKAVFVNEICK